MSESAGVEQILSQVMDREREYNWLGAVELYEKALRLMPETDFLKLGQIQELVGYSFYRAAMQAEGLDQFRERMSQAVANFEKAKKLFGVLSEPRKTPRMLRCDAMVAYIGYWLASEVPEKKRLLDDCWRLTNEALKAFEESGDAWEYGTTYNRLSLAAVFKCFLEWDFQVRKETVKEALERGEQAIALLSTHGDPDALTRAYLKTSSFSEWFGIYFLDLDESETYFQKAADYWQKANELSEETAQIELLNCSAMAVQDSIGWATGTDTALSNFQRALEHGRKTKDRFIIGSAIDWLTYHTFWKALATEDPDKTAELLKSAVQYAQDAKQQFARIGFISLRGGTLWIEAPYVEYYWKLAAQETNPTNRRELLEKAEKTAVEGLRRADDSGYPDVISMAHYQSGKILSDLAAMETNSEKKKALLEKALSHSNRALEITEQLQPLMYWNRGMMQTILADIKSELADFAKDLNAKQKMLQEAIQDKESSLRLCAKYALFWQKKGSFTLFANVGEAQYRYGDLLNHLYGLNNNKEYLRKALEAFEDATASYRKLNLMSRIAECHWKAAQTLDGLGEHLKAAKSFDLASENYKSAEEKIPQLKDFYEDHAMYMQAWSEIEKARHYHRKQEYGFAKEHFDQAANIHTSLRQWSYLTPNYAAWAQVERAEELSRKEQSEEACRTFEEAAKLFNETKERIQTQLNKIEDLDEKQMATNMLKATGLRHLYCLARMAIEEAKILDKKGDHYSSSEKYESAAQTLERITQALESEQDQKELKYIAVLSRAWQKMMLADARTSPELYIEASQLFEQASELSVSEIAGLQTLGHSRFCKALENGTKFADTRHTAFYSAAMQYLQSATSYYQRAGLESVAEYARAAGLLFEAYMHMDNAKKEIDPEKKARLYMVAERVLQASAGCYTKAEHPEKREQVLRMLEKVREERELAWSLAEVLHAPIIASTTAFPAPTPTSEKAVGLEKFEHAEVHANITTRQKELKVGDYFDLEIELVNAGKGLALLTKITEVIPKGFELTEKPETCRVEDSSLNMKGKRLDPLKIEEVRLTMKPKVQGVFALKPNILYLDENGNYRSHEPEPITITVKELGIKGWLKGER